MIEIFKDRVEKDIFKPNHDPYRNPQFLVKKKKKDKYCLINIIMEINRVIIKNINLPPSINEFFEEFIKYIIVSLIDFFSSYDQIKLDEKSRNLTTFHTPIGLLRMTTLSYEATNSVTQFARIIIKILQEYIPRLYFLFLDDIGVKGSKIRYDDVRIFSDIRRFILEYI